MCNIVYNYQTSQNIDNNNNNNIEYATRAYIAVIIHIKTLGKFFECTS